MKDLYKILGVSEDASEADIKKAYRTLARTLHPDATGGDKAKTERFKEVSDAWSVLGDPAKRAEYDRLRRAPMGVDGMPQGFDPEIFASIFGEMGGRPGGRRGGTRVHFRGDDGEGYANLNDLFSSLFGQGPAPGHATAGRGRAGVPPRGQDMSAKLELTFAEAALGGKRTVIPGSGRPIEVTVPPGVEHGGRLRIARQGAPAAGGSGSPGDLYLDIVVKPDPYLVRTGDDIELELPVNLLEAALGARLQVPTIDGPVWVHVPPGSSSGRKLRLRGKGVARPDGSRGDQLCRIRVVVPAIGEDDSESRRLLEALVARTQKQPVRDFDKR